MNLIKLLFVLTIFFVVAVPSFSNENTIKVKVGNNFKIELKSNATTGYQWKLAAPLDEKIVRLVSSDYIAPNTNLIGAGGKEVWVFKAVRKGKTKITLDYVRAWEKISPEMRNIYIVEVR